VCVLLLQDLLQSCSHTFGPQQKQGGGGGRRSEDTHSARGVFVCVCSVKRDLISVKIAQDTRSGMSRIQLDNQSIANNEKRRRE